MMPRQVLPGSIYLLTRRCTQRQYWLKPSRMTNSIVSFCIAYAAKKTGILVHAACAMSNHLHVVVTDPDAREPEFTHIMHMYIARCLNAYYGRRENLWASEAPSVVRLETDAAVFDEIVYTLTNPTAALLVPNSDSWPGFRTRSAHVAGHRQTVRRPEVYFDPAGCVPEVLQLEITRPAIFEDANDAEFAERVRAEVASREAGIRAQAAAQRRRFAGITVVKSQRPIDSPRANEPRGMLNPKIAARDKERRKAAVRRLRAFYEAYREAYDRFRADIRDVVFPAGTYAMRHRHAVLVAGFT